MSIHYYFSGVFPMNYEINADCNYTSATRFKKQNYYDWFDPENWINPSTIPHVFQVPCKYDHVKFPSKTAFKVRITQNPVEIGLMSIDQIRIGKLP